MNILHAGDKSPVQRGFFTNSTGDLVPTLGFLGGLYIKSRWYVEVVTYFTDLEMIEYYQKTCGWNCYWGIPDITFSAEQISHVPFYYVEDVYHKNQQGKEV